MAPSPVLQQARNSYLTLLAGSSSQQAWWDTVILTASSPRQAESCRFEIHHRLEHGHLPASARYLVAPDPAGTRIGSGAATLNALLNLDGAPGRTLLIHSGGDARRLPQYSLSGKLFSALPVRTPWGEASTVFDEFLALSALWAASMPPGLLVSSGDVLLVFDIAEVQWPERGVHGIAMRQPPETGTQHGVYILGPDQRVYAFLQKPSLSEVVAAGGELAGPAVAVDTGLLYFDPQTVAALSAVSASINWTHPPVIDLYRHCTLALTSQWSPAPGDPPALHHLAGVLRGVPFTASLVEGEFTHIGATLLFREMMAGASGVAALYAAHQRLGASTLPGVRSSGVIVDSVLGCGEIDPGAVVIECSLKEPFHAARGSVAHGLDGIDAKVEIPEDTVLHQAPVRLPSGVRGTVIRAFGVQDNPKDLVSDGKSTWFGRPIVEMLQALGLAADLVWPDVPPAERCLWNARLFPLTGTGAAWECARWLMGLPSRYSVPEWCESERLSLASSAAYADELALLQTRTRRARAQWETAAVRLAADGADVRPMLAQSPGLGALSSVAASLEGQARTGENGPTEAASLSYQAGLFYKQAGLEAQSLQARSASFEHVARAVRAGVVTPASPQAIAWSHREVRVAAPARIDLGGGWSDTPPFCLDWGGTVLNAAVSLDGAFPIEGTIRVIPEPVIRCLDLGGGAVAEYSQSEQLFEPPGPGDPFAIARSLFQLSGLFTASEPLGRTMQRLGGGLELTTSVQLPMGSGLGTSSILAAAVLQAFQTLTGRPLEAQPLSDAVLALEQYMSTGGGWQDQAGGIFPGLKLISSGPGLRQRIHARQLVLSPQRLEELESLLVLVWTGITRVARGLLHEVVGRYLARETRAVEVLHSIKTLALEMAHAIELGDWDYLGELLDRHWALNQVLDPNTTNAPIEAMLSAVRPHVRGAKLAGAGGGGFLILLAKSRTDTADLRILIEREFAPSGAAVHGWRLAADGLRLTTRQ